MKVLFPASEVVPFSKTGGLADVAGALPQALARLGHDVLVVTPWYSRLGGGTLPYWIGDVAAPFSGGFEDVGVGVLEREGVRYAFVGHPDFRRERLYGYPDDARRFARFSRAVPQVAARLGFVPDVVHAHDWHTGYLPMLLRRGWHLPQGFPALRSVFTIHNVQYQGESGLAETVHWLRLGDDLTRSYLNHFGRANAMQAGAGFAAHVTTVSPTYADELRTPEFGFTLDGTFRTLGRKLTGILNGIDTAAWDPATDQALPRPYSAADPSGKEASRSALAQRFGLTPGRPVMGVVSRLVEQKGIDLLVAAAPELVSLGWSLALLGAGDAALEARIADLQRTYPGIVGAATGYDDRLARLIYGGADALAVPSRFEPCGLTQMIAMRYGTLPVVHATGGLKDTVAHGRTGFVFEHATTAGLVWAAEQARRTFGTPKWARMMAAAMTEDHSWGTSAASYSELYRHVLRS